MISSPVFETERTVEKKTMHAAVITEARHVELCDVAIPELAPDQIRVRLEGCGVCASNIPPWEGRPWFSYPMLPGALGHEGWGRVDSFGRNIYGFKIGERVAILSHHAYAESDVADVGAVVRLPANLDGKPFPAEPLGCAMNIFQRSEIEKNNTVAIVGIGFLGALLTQLASAAGARVLAISRRDFALKFPARMGAEKTIPMDDHARIIEEIKSLTGGKFCDVVIEAVGKQWPLDLAAELTRERGRLVIAGYHQDGLRQVNMQLWNWRGLDVINAHERDPRMYLAGMRAAVEAVTSGLLDPAPLYTHRFPLGQLDAALNETIERSDGFMKALIEL